MFVKEKFLETLEISLRLDFGTTLEKASEMEKYLSLSRAIMSYVAKQWADTKRAYENGRQAYYFSAEFLVGRSLGNNLINLCIYDEIKEILDELNIDLDTMEELEEDAGLGNGGLGRLAACFMESAATLELPLQGYGVRYKEGLFKQKFVRGFQYEQGDDWTGKGDPWSIRRESLSQIVKFRDFSVKAIPYDMPIIGYDTKNINTLRLWQSEAVDEFDFQKFNEFKFDEAVAAKNRAEDITRVLYPNDHERKGKILRFMQQYFFTSASIKDMIDNYRRVHGSLEGFAKNTRIQLNDTHPVIAIAELMRLLYDEERYRWDYCFEMAQEIFSYTNHTILKEALEAWDIDIVQEVCPRNFEIIQMIDHHFISVLQSKGYEKSEIDKMKIISGNSVRMAHLGIVASHTVNGVAQLHTEILKEQELRDWYELYPDKFQNKTNGITPRRWLDYSNKRLSAWITNLLGSKDWIKDLDRLVELKKFADDENKLKELLEIKQKNKRDLAAYISKHEGIIIDPESIFDIQVKRIHEYKRQLLNALHIVYLYQKLKENPDYDMVPRTFIFGGKAAPGYFRAKAIIKFINEIARVVNSDPEVNGKLKVVFVTNYRVSYGERLFSAADISEQISTAGKEASGTGNMKFMLNGTPTIGTYDGANVEIVQEAGRENNFIFGATVEELNEIRHKYNPMDLYRDDETIRQVVDSLMSPLFNDENTFMLLDIYNAITRGSDWEKADAYFILHDFADYVKAQQEVDKIYRDRNKWAKMCLMNIAGSGKFSSDRTINDYAKEIWGISPAKVD
ncbi:MAG: glycogen/starch/alpha-glucan phosphorylase [Tissierellia bacterium]|nr:glycogen/starch/alpha-glucan phosphorylase [Tissierellia bacterium]